MAKSAAHVVAQFAPQAAPAFRAAFAAGDGLLTAAGITSPIRVAHFMAQVFQETGALTLLVEGGTYTAVGLARMWDGGNWHRYFASRGACLAMASQCAIDHGVALFNLVYGNRMGNGPAASGDGWKFRGRGVLQTTGREAYERFGTACHVDFIGQPDLVIAPEHMLKPALSEWTAGHLNAAADNNDINVITHTINGGLTGLDGRKAWFAKFFPFLTGANPVEQSREWQVQERLAAAGYDLHPDGVIGTETRKAILDYRVKHGLPTSPGITSDLLLSLGVA